VYSRVTCAWLATDWCTVAVTDTLRVFTTLTRPLRHAPPSPSMPYSLRTHANRFTAAGVYCETIHIVNGSRPLQSKTLLSRPNTYTSSWVGTISRDTKYAVAAVAVIARYISRRTTLMPTRDVACSPLSDATCQIQSNSFWLEAAPTWH